MARFRYNARMISSHSRRLVSQFFRFTAACLLIAAVSPLHAVEQAVQTPLADTPVEEPNGGFRITLPVGWPVSMNEVQSNLSAQAPPVIQDDPPPASIRITVDKQAKPLAATDVGNLSLTLRNRMKMSLKEFELLEKGEQKLRAGKAQFITYQFKADRRTWQSFTFTLAHQDRLLIFTCRSPKNLFARHRSLYLKILKSLAWMDGWQNSWTLDPARNRLIHARDRWSLRVPDQWRVNEIGRLLRLTPPPNTKKTIPPSITICREHLIAPVDPARYLVGVKQHLRARLIRFTPLPPPAFTHERSEKSEPPFVLAFTHLANGKSQTVWNIYFPRGREFVILTGTGPTNPALDWHKTTFQKTAESLILTGR